MYVAPTGLVRPTTTKPTLATLSRAQGVGFIPGDAHILGHYHLREPHTRLNSEGFLPKVNHQRTHLTPVVGINSANAIHHRHTIPATHAATGAYLHLVPF